MKILISYLRTNFHTDKIRVIQKLLFPLKRKILCKIKEMYLDNIFIDNYLKYNVLRNHMHFVIIDLLDYKIKPYNSIASNNTVKNKPKVILNIDFINKGLDMINVPRILRDKSLRSLVNFCNIKEPSVVYSSMRDISSKIFNYNNTVKELDDVNNIICKCSDHDNFINSDCGHVATGDISIFKSTKLQDILMKCPGYHEPVRLDFDAAYTAIMNNIDNMLDLWSKKEGICVQCFDGWKLRFKQIVLEDINKLKVKYNLNYNVKSVFSDNDLSTELDYFHKFFVLCPIDKASKNVAVICKKYYIETIINECRLNIKSYCNSSTLNVNDIYCEQLRYLKSIGLESDVKDILPHMVLFPKFHKPKLSQRFVVSYANCIIKPLARNITLGLKTVYNQICRYSNMIFKVTGINRNWIVNNNVPIIECFDNNSNFRNIETYDFTTLYTSLLHDEIKVALSSVVKLAFKHSKCSYIAIYNKSSSFVKSTRPGTWFFDENSLIESLNYLLDNCYFTIGNLVFRQIIGVPMGVDPGPYIANLTLWFYENRYLEVLYRTDYFSAKLLNKTYRLIDDITTINTDGIFKKHMSNIYPASLILNKENERDDSAHVLDFDIHLVNGVCELKLYDKRDDFPFNIVQYVHFSSNVPRCILYGTRRYPLQCSGTTVNTL